MQRKLVHLGDDAVDLVGHVVACRCQLVATRHHRSHALDLPGVRTDGKPRLLQLGQRRRLRHGGPGAPGGRTLHEPDGVGPEVQWPLCRDARVLLTQRAGGGVARVDEEALPGVGLALVHRLEVGDRHVDLPAHLEHAGVGTARLGELLGDVLHGADVGRHVLA